MTEATSATILTHSNSNSSDLTLLTEESANSLLSSVETNVSAENAVAFSWGSTDRTVSSGLAATKLNRDVAAAMVSTVLTCESLGCLRVLFILDESDSAGLSILHDQLALGHGSVFGEDAVKHVLVNVERQGSNEDFKLVSILGISYFSDLFNNSSSLGGSSFLGSWCFIGGRVRAGVLGCFLCWRRLLGNWFLFLGRRIIRAACSLLGCSLSGCSLGWGSFLGGGLFLLG
jgi:hypothetical protein